MRSLLAVLVTLVVVAASAAVPAVTEAQASASRFEIVDVADSTVSFATARERWVKRGLQGIAVDPMRRDALIARLVVLEAGRGQATALITGQTARLNGEHVVLIQRPPTPFYRQRTFWMGAVLGAALGAVVAAQ